MSAVRVTILTGTYRVYLIDGMSRDDAWHHVQRHHAELTPEATREVTDLVLSATWPSRADDVGRAADEVDEAQS